MKVLVTGAAGRVGRYVARELASAGHALRLLDLKPCDGLPGEALQGDIADWDAVRSAVEGMEGIVHLAAYVPSHAARGLPAHVHWESDVRVDVLGTDLLLHAAREAGVKRFVYTSSNSVFDMIYPQKGEQLGEDATPRPRSHYGVCKYLGEELCRFFADVYGLSCVVLRLNTVTLPDCWETVKQHDTPEVACMRVHVQDVARAVRFALEKEGLQWDIFRVTGDNVDQRWPMDYTRTALGYAPEYGFDMGKMFRHGQPVEGTSRVGH